MKLRFGFVSNSSSSSFLIYGVCIGDHNLRRMLNVPYDDTKDEYANSDDLERVLSKNLGALEHYNPCNNGEHFLGLCWSGVGNNETGAQFKARAEKEIKRLLGKPQKCSTLSEAWRDG